MARAFAAVLVVGAVVLWRPFLMREHETISATPTPIALYEPVPISLRPEAIACLHGVTFERDSAVIGFTARGSGPLIITAAAPGYHALAVARAPLVRALVTPPRAPVTGRLCVRNAGHRAVVLPGTTDAGSTASPVTTVDGHPIAPDVAITLYRREPSSHLARAADIVDHAAAFAWSPALLWLLGALVVLGVPAAIAYGLALTTSDRPDSPSRAGARAERRR
jgi:hypothetical protein